MKVELFFQQRKVLFKVNPNLIDQFCHNQCVYTGNVNIQLLNYFKDLFIYCFLCKSESKFQLRINKANHGNSDVHKQNKTVPSIIKEKDFTATITFRANLLEAIKSTHTSQVKWVANLTLGAWTLVHDHLISSCHNFRPNCRILQSEVDYFKLKWYVLFLK